MSDPGGRVRQVPHFPPRGFTMCHQTGQHSLPESDRASLDFLRVREGGGRGKDSRPGARGLPSFLSSAPPRSEGEALLRRIFSRGGAV
jgi:hypothetical protein